MDYWVLEKSLVIIKTKTSAYNILVIIHDKEGVKINTLIFQNIDLYVYGSKDVVRIGVIKRLGNGFYALNLDNIPEKLEVLVFDEKGNLKEREKITF